MQSRRIDPVATVLVPRCRDPAGLDRLGDCRLALAARGRGFPQGVHSVFPLTRQPGCRSDRGGNRSVYWQRLTAFNISENANSAVSKTSKNVVKSGLSVPVRSRRGAVTAIGSPLELKPQTFVQPYMAIARKTRTKPSGQPVDRLSEGETDQLLHYLERTPEKEVRDALMMSPELARSCVSRCSPCLPSKPR
jgi:hypothetical protein